VLQFALNGGCGYVLKPEWMINPSGKNPLPTREPLRLGVLVHSAYAAQGNNCACFKDDLYVQVWAVLSNSRCAAERFIASCCQA
jgi:hypothetical protein